MRKNGWRAVAGFCLMSLWLVLMPSADAFFPAGIRVAGDQYSAPRIIYRTWQLSQMDTNGNGNVDPGEGIPFVFSEQFTQEFTPLGQQVFSEGMEIWENVPSAYVAFRFPFTAAFDNGVPPPPGTLDSYNLISVDERSSVPQGMGGIVAITFVPRNAFLQINGQTVPITGPKIIDADIVVAPNWVWVNVPETGNEEQDSITGQMTLARLHGLAAHLAGHAIGLSFSPLDYTLTEPIDMPLEGFLQLYYPAQYQALMDALAQAMALLEQYYRQRPWIIDLLVYLYEHDPAAFLSLAQAFAQTDATAAQLDNQVNQVLQDLGSTDLRPLEVDYPYWNSGNGFRGVTPTMNPSFFVQSDFITLSQSDLAPDDIAGVTFLYPRGDQENFFTLKHEARTDAISGVPSAPIVGGYIQVWCDTGNPVFPRVPMYDTITSLYYPFNQAQWGYFELPKMFKQILDFDNVVMSATYTVTLSEIGDLPSALLGQSQVSNAGTQTTGGTSGGTGGGTTGGGTTGGGTTGGGTTGGGTTGGGTTGTTGEKGASSYDFAVYPSGTEKPYTTGFPLQTFVEGGRNIYALAPDSGTPLYFDPVRRQIVSANTGKTLAQMLPGTKPMFGKAINETVCPLNLAASTLPVKEGPRALREFRDTVLLRTALGTALAEAYYRAGPAVCGILKRHPSAMGGARMFLLLLEWVLTHLWVCAIVAGSLVGMVSAWWLIRRRAALKTATLLVVFALFLAGNAEAQFLKMNTSDMVEKSDEILVGKVVAVESRWTEQNQIVTDVTIQVEDSWKGRLNKSGLVHFSQLGGEKDGIITYVPQYPAWNVGEEVVTFLQHNEKFGFMPLSGTGGKFNVKTEAATGKKYLEAPSVPAKNNLDQIRADMEKTKAKTAAKAEEASDVPKEDGTEDPAARRVTLDDLKSHIKTVEQELKRKNR